MIRSSLCFEVLQNQDRVVDISIQIGERPAIGRKRWIERAAGSLDVNFRLTGNQVVTFDACAAVDDGVWIELERVQWASLLEVETAAARFHRRDSGPVLDEHGAGPAQAVGRQAGSRTSKQSAPVVSP